MNKLIKDLWALLEEHDGINDKAKLSKIVVSHFSLTKDRSVFFCENFAIRFSASDGQNFGNTVASLSRLQKFDGRPFVVCVVTPKKNFALLANTSLLKKVSHSSQKLRENNIRGSFNGSDIMRELNEIANNGANLLRLFSIHSGIGFDGNLARLVEATNNISPSGEKFDVNERARLQILDAPARAQRFVRSNDYAVLKNELDEKVEKFKSEILLATLIENVNVRGRIIEYLIAGRDELLKKELVNALHHREKGIPPFKTDNTLGDYTRIFEEYRTETDVKTKIMILDSNPKAYNLDKILEFLSSDKSVFMFYFVGLDLKKIVNTALVSMFQEKLLNSTILLKHWAGRNSRGVSQFEGKTISALIDNPEQQIDAEFSVKFLTSLIAI